MSEEAYPSCRFYVQIDNKKQAVFSEVSGLQIEITVTEHEEGGNNGFVYRLPGRAKVSNLTLKRGMTRTNEFLVWLMQIAGGEIVKQNVTVLMYDSAGKEVMRWNMINAYPTKWSGPQLKADANAAAIETLELTHEGVTLS